MLLCTLGTIYIYIYIHFPFSTAYWLKKKVSNSEHEVLSLVTNVVTKERILG